jgi:hypothetical protein
MRCGAILGGRHKPASPYGIIRLTMLAQLAHTLEQLDLALEQIVKGDANSARFGLMLTDNAVEISLHRIAANKDIELRQWHQARQTFPHAEALTKALGRNFDPKLQLAALLKIIGAEAQETLRICHTFRNEVYHVGVEHEAILPELARFHFNVACSFFSALPVPGLGWSSDMRMPDRAKKYFTASGIILGTIEQFHAGCRTLGTASGHQPKSFVAALRAHLTEVIEEHDNYIDLLATGGPKRMSRDEAVIECQLWPLAFSDEGRRFVAEKRPALQTLDDYMKWLAANYPLKHRRDPIAGWQRRAAALGREQSSHRALKMYRNFMDQTASLRAQLEESARQVEQYIDGEIERAMMERSTGPSTYST